MKIWVGYGSEHSANLVMIGRFEDVGGASQAMRVIEQLTSQVNADIKAGLLTVGEPTARYTDAALDLLGRVNVNTIGPAELEQFAYDVTVKVEGNEVVITTDEIDVSAFLKVLIDKGARVEVYSAHDHPGGGYGRGG